MPENVLNAFYAQQIAFEQQMLADETIKFNMWDCEHKVKVVQFNSRATPANIYIKFDGAELGYPEFE